MSEQDTWSAVDTYLKDRLVGSDAALQAALAGSRAAGLPDIQVSPTQGKFLMLMAQAIRARSILEIGTLAGYSSIWLARALPADGLLVTCELNAKHADVARANIERAGLASLVQLRLGPALETLAELIRAQHPPFDLVFIDADKPAYVGYLNQVLQLSHSGTVILGDNLIRHADVVAEVAPDELAVGVKEYNSLIATHPRLESILLPILKGKVDGMSISRVK